MLDRLSDLHIQEFILIKRSCDQGVVALRLGEHPPGLHPVGHHGGQRLLPRRSLWTPVSHPHQVEFDGADIVMIKITIMMTMIMMMMDSCRFLGEKGNFYPVERDTPNAVNLVLLLITILDD